MPDKMHVWLAKSGSYESLFSEVKEPDDNYDFWMEEEFNIDSFESELVGETFLEVNPSIDKIVEQILYERVAKNIVNDLQNSDIDLKQVDSFVTMVSTERDNLYDLKKRNASNGKISLWYLGSYDLPN